MMLSQFLSRFSIFNSEGVAKKKPRAAQGSLIKRDIHIPPLVVGILSGCFLAVLLTLELGSSIRTFLSVCIFLGVVFPLFIFYIRHELPEMVKDDEAMMCLGVLVLLFVGLVGALQKWPASFYLTPIPAASILAALLLHPRIALALSLVLTIVHGMAQGYSFDCFVLGFFGSLAATVAAIYIRTHKDFIRTGGLVAFAYFLAMLMISLIRSYPIAEFLWGSLWLALNGFLSAILALGLLPFLESFFLRVTPLKLLELSDFNHPLLKRLMLEAPGTYHHSLLMATIAEAAARAVGANGLLARVGAYYHDVGKLVKPEYFIENQGNAPHNPHQKIAPQLSSLVLISHVKEGMALARQAKLPEEIVNFIPMHHGTSRVDYFYHLAVEDVRESAPEQTQDHTQEELPSLEQTYRYPGPRPKTKETAILMLADSVEAASRTLEDPNHARLKDLVERIVQKKMKDGQLADSLLTFSDLKKIQESFVKTLSSIYHSRIEYPPEN